ncbi:phytanoyl-CoA dioxygenase family protein [Paenibacillus lignilyticus]|uniref:Phytanoyl-CoA dioxygenase family protein n=1 Tax=Paenibacillus lignilyticus TaxID=1172615 RepID=A0ABS5C7R3_9BACL|nr:phytanoyl-CoA dioxygenase family protein [Paenibacillus lignilyticus]MBP3962041.1 phytanoyl-CoA dioxygenase family protein [Paenibacillus lignilyticus]
MKPITAEQAKLDQQFYEENGYWISPVVFDAEEVEALRKAHDRIWNQDFDGDAFPLTEWFPSDNPTRLRKIDNAWWINDEVYKTVTARKLGKLAANLMNTDEVRVWYDQAIYKPGTGKGQETSVGNVGWHQDYVYWQCTNTTNLVTAWIALQDTDLTNGCMQVIPGSHKWGLLNSDGFFNTELEAVKKQMEVDEKPWREEPLILKAGQVSFHHSYTIHGSRQNYSNDPRLSIVAHYIPQGTAYKKIQNVDNIRLLGPRPKEGDLYDNQYFPLAYSASEEK